MNRSTLLTLGLLGVFVLAACTPTASVPPPAPTLAPEAAAPEPESAAPEAAEPVAEAPDAPEASAVEEAVGEPPARGNKLEATDPTTVNIANGKPQLIEFFAFW